MKFEDIKTGDKVAVRIIAVVPNKIDGYVESIGKQGAETFPSRPKKVKSVKKGTVVFKNQFFFTIKKENGLKECFSNAEMTCGEVEVKNV